MKKVDVRAESVAATDIPEKSQIKVGNSPKNADKRQSCTKKSVRILLTRAWNTEPVQRDGLVHVMFCSEYGSLKLFK